MAVTWGAWSSLSRLGIDLVRTAQSASAETWKITVWVETKGYVADNYNTVTVSGAFTFSGNVPVNRGSAGTVKLWESSRTFTRQYGKNVSQSVSASITEFAAGSPRHSRSFTVAARAYLTPVAAGAVQARYLSVNRAVISWVPKTSTGSPVSGFVVERQVRGSSDWVKVSSPSASSTSFTDTGTTTGNEYRWRVRQTGSGGSGPWTETAWVAMTPDWPSNVTAARSDSDIVVSWVGRSNISTSTFEILEGDTVIASVPNSARSYRVLSPDPAVAHRYAVREVAGDLRSNAILSNSVQLISKPDTPTLLVPDGDYVPAGAEISTSWTHNAVDGSPQTAYQIRVSTNDGATWEELPKQTSPDSGAVLDATYAVKNVPLLWQVRTWGAHADGSDWSNEARVYPVERPVVLVTAPGATVSASTATIQFAPQLPAGKTFSYTARLTESGSEVGSWSGNGTATSAGTTVRIPVWGLQNNKSYTFTVSIQTEVVSHPVSHTFVVSYLAPAAPTVLIDWDRSIGQAILKITNPTVSGVAPTHHNRVVRRGEPNVDFGTVAINSTLTDNTVTGNGRVEYEVVAVSVEGTESTTVVELNTSARPISSIILLSADNALRAWLPYNIEKSEEFELEFADKHFFRGRETPVMFAGRERNRTLDIEGVLAASEHPYAKLKDFRRIVRHAMPILYRDPSGDQMWGMIKSISFDRDRATGQYVIGFSMEEVAHDE